MKMIPLTTVRPGQRVHAFQGPNAGKWGTVILKVSRTIARIQWDAPAPAEQPATEPTLFT